MKRHKLDAEEARIEKEFEDYKPVSEGVRNRVGKIIKASRKSRAISLRINEKDLRILKEKAEKNGLPYQTMINVVLHKYVTDAYLDKEEINKYLKLKAG
jgi:predicted DNA binding CopG/RHH family protein